MTLLTLVRHGQTDWNFQRRIQGSTDVPLNETGRDDARAAAAALADRPHHAIYSSPLLRAQETAEIIARELGLHEPLLVPDLREREFGEGEGLLVTEYLDRFGDWFVNPPGAETLDEVRDRAFDALHQIARDSRRRSAPMAESVIVVTHGGVLSSLLRHASSGSLPLPGEPLRNGSVHRFEASPGVLRLIESAPLRPTT